MQRLSIHVADRECDFYEFFRESANLGEHVLIRAARNRSINKAKRRGFPSVYLFDHLKEKRAQGQTAISIQVNGKEKFRDAKLSIIYTTITMPPPPNKTIKKDGPLLMIELTAIMAVERNPPKDHDSICWVLLTNLPINTLEEAIEKIGWYSLRWNIELFHKVITSGCAVEKSQLRDADRLKKYIVLKSVIAWRLFWLSRHYIHHENDCCLTVLTMLEWTILYRKINTTKKLPETPSTVGVAFIWIAKLGGMHRKAHRSTTRDDQPMERLATINGHGSRLQIYLWVMLRVGAALTSDLMKNAIVTALSTFIICASTVKS